MNYYEILNLPKTASKQQIKSSYKRLVKKYHPDLYAGDKNLAEQKIKEINEAYDVLSHPEKKSEYDAFLAIQSEPAIVYSASETFYEESDSSSSETTLSLTKWLTEKFSQLDKKQQLQIFTAVFILILCFFMLNLVEMKYYLKPSENSINPSNTLENKTNNFIDNSFDDSLNYPYSDDFRNFDNFLYDLFTTYDNSLEIDSFVDSNTASPSF